MDPGLARRRERGNRSRAEDAVLPDQRAVEVARDRGDVAGKALGKAQLVDSTTYAATSAISCSLRLSPNGGIAP